MLPTTPAGLRVWLGRRFEKENSEPNTPKRVQLRKVKNTEKSPFWLPGHSETGLDRDLEEQ